jgi:hypothetical protein
MTATGRFLAAGVAPLSRRWTNPVDSANPLKL